MSVLIDLGLVCAVCLQDKNELHSIFEPDLQAKMSVAEKIAKCSELEIKPSNKKLPDHICQQCLDDLKVAWRFRQQCEIASALFRSLQIQDNDIEAEANMVLHEQKIKLPTGLKIKKIQPEAKTFLLPMKNVIYVDKEYSGAQEEATSTPDQSEQVVYAKDEIELEDTDLEHYETVQISNDLEDGEETENLLDTNAAPFKAAKSDFIPESDKVPRRVRGLPKKPEIISSTVIKAEITPVAIKKVKSETPMFEPHQKTHEPMEKITNRKLPVKPPTENFKSMDQLHARRKRKNEQTKKICEICGNCYKYQHALNAHMRRHTNEKPFRCEFCEKAFVSGVELRRHMRVHTGQKPYACKFCERAFSDFGSRIKHERTHTGERPYVCATCGKAFAYAHVLSVHIRTHTGEKRFQCTTCNKGFTKKAYLLTHMELHNTRGELRSMREERNIKLEVFEIVGDGLSCSVSPEYVTSQQNDEQTGEEFADYIEKQEEMSDSDEVLSVVLSEEHLEDTQG